MIDPIRRSGRFAALAVLALLAAACSGQKDSARKLIADIDTSVTAASPEAAKYVPEQLEAVQTKLGQLKGAYDRKDYAGVVAQGPQVLTEAQSLATAAAAKKDRALQVLDDQWSSLSAEIPADIAALQNRTELLGKPAGKKMPAGVDLGAAQSALSDATGLWSKAQAAFAAGNLGEAVGTAKDVKIELQAVAARVKTDLPVAGGAPAASSP